MPAGQAVVRCKMSGRGRSRALRVVAITGPQTPRANTVEAAQEASALAACGRAGLSPSLFRRYANGCWCSWCSPTSADEQSLQQNSPLQWPSHGLRRIARSPGRPAEPASPQRSSAGASLVLLDEVGAGTIGRGRAAGDALLPHLADRAAADAGTTHFVSSGAEIRPIPLRERLRAGPFDLETLSPPTSCNGASPARSNAPCDSRGALGSPAT